MALRLFDTLAREVRTFEPLHEGEVRVYACGPTVYKPPHIGNYRTFLFNDLLLRYLAWKGWNVRFVMNLTDVEDKTIAAAAEGGISLDAYTAPIIDAFFEDLDALGVRRDRIEFPRATEHIEQMTALVQRLVDGGHAYVAEDGSVYFDISSFPGYGRLSRVDLAGNRAGAGLQQRERGRVTTDEYEKEDARDFVLWKAARAADRAVGAAWPTAWGEGRPGWHIECSAMSMARLGETFDIHTGGEDLVFPHHEDEIAQSEAATGKPFARYWLHVKHLRVAGEKMSKSRRNDYTLGDILERGYSPATVRWLLLSAHYRSELNFTFEGLDDARASIRRLADFRDRLGRVDSGDVAAGGPLRDAAHRALAGFEAALDDDLNVSAALAALFGLVREGNAALDAAPTVAAGDRDAALEAVARMDDILGVLALEDAGAAIDEGFASWVDDLVARRTRARAERDFSAADAIRDELAAAGVVVEDTPSGPVWKKR